MDVPREPPSPREAEVLALLGRHLTYAEIGARLFISPRTVESHVDSLRRKLALDRRGLARLAERSGPTGHAALPEPLTSFVGRTQEVRTATEALARSRLVSVVGPGGVGKTRLALRTATSAAAAAPVWFVDLVPLRHAGPVAQAVLHAVGAAGPGSPEEELVLVFGDRPGLLVLDNAEHVLDGVARLAEVLLGRCHRLRLLVTSRSRMVVPFERVIDLAPLSLGPDGDAVDLLADRAGCALDRSRAARICAAVGGLPLAVELAAGRIATLGIDGVEAALEDQVRLLVGGMREDQRHRSLTATLDWSYDLLTPGERDVFRRSAVFRAAFDPAAARQVTAFGTVSEEDVPDLLGRLRAAGLLAVTPSGRLRMLEPLRQYAATRQGAVEHRQLLDRHAAWARRVAQQLLAAEPAGPAWTTRCDTVIDDLLAAGHRAPGDLARVAEILFLRGRLRDAQQAEEDAAGPASADRLLRAAWIASCRVSGEDAFRLLGAAAVAFDRMLLPGAAVRTRARAAEHVARFSGMYAGPPPDAAPLLARLAGQQSGDPRAAAAVLVAEAASAPPADAERRAEAALAAARECGDLHLTSAALDLVTAALWDGGRLHEATRRAAERAGVLEAAGRDPESELERKDVLHMLALSATASGDLTVALGAARAHADLPFLRMQDDLAVEPVFLPAALSGQVDGLPEAAERYRSAWERSGAPVAPGRAMAPTGAALAFGLAGDEDGWSLWTEIAHRMRGSTRDAPGYGPVCAAVLLLHQGRAGEAALLLDVQEEETSQFVRAFGGWHIALRVEAAVLAGEPAAERLLASADVAGHPIGRILLQRAAALLMGDARAVAATAVDLDAAACPYQAGRSRSLAISTTARAGGPAEQARAAPR